MAFKISIQNLTRTGQNSTKLSNIHSVQMSLPLGSLTEFKTCRRCGDSKPRDDGFHRDRKQRDGLSPWCKECNCEHARAYKAKMAARTEVEIPAEQRCQICREVKPAAAFKLNRTTRSGLQHACYNCFRDQRYGLEPGEYERRMKEQQGVCAVCHKNCSRKTELAVDHDHKTGQVRGLLCQNCNAGLGMFFDDPRIIARAIKYIVDGDSNGY